MKLIDFLKRKLKKPEFRLVPNARGKYDLQRWNASISAYLPAAVHVSKEEAEETIKALGRETLYWTGDK